MTQDSDLKNTPFFKKMLADADNMEKDRVQFNSKYKDFLASDTGLTSIILRCHLIIEHFLDEYLISSYPSIKNWDKARLSFLQKLELADSPSTVIHLIMPSLKCINIIRNKLAHNLEIGFEDLNLEPIHKFMSIWKTAGGYPIPKGMDLITEFTIFASSTLNGSSKLIERHGKGKGLLGLQDWYKEG